MKANICLLFPISDDDVVAWAIQQDATRPIVKELGNILQVVRNLGLECTFYYDSSNFNDFARKIKALDSDKCYMGKAIEQIKMILSRKLKDVNAWKQQNCNENYVEWVSSTCSINANVPLVYRYAVNTLKRDQCVIVNFNIPDANQDNEIHVIKDTHPTTVGLPVICSFPLMETLGDTIAWLYFLSNEDFSLRNPAVFIPTSYFWPSSHQRMYRRINAHLQNSLWYFDFYHKDNKQHYEVFDETGRHLGEADMNGELIPNTKDPSKSIAHILHGR